MPSDIATGLAISRYSGLSLAVFPCYDANGNVTELVDANGVLQARYEYDAFGQQTAVTGAKPAACPFRFSTKYWDPDVSLYYYGYRWYDPWLGRWLSRDPIGEKGGENLYGFVGNEPVSRWDCIGLWSELKRDKDSMYGTSCAGSGDTVESLAQKLASDEDVHLDAVEALGANGWLRQDGGAAVNAITPGRVYRFPNSIHITYGNMMPNPMFIHRALKRDMGHIEDYLTRRRFYVVNHVEGTGMSGNTLGQINRWLSAVYTVGWAHGGHGHSWLIPETGTRMSRGAIVLGGSAESYPQEPRPDAHTWTSMTPHHRMSIIILNVCYGAVGHEDNWFNMLASGGSFEHPMWL